MKITVIGTGYVGLVSGVCLASIGHEVVCVDNDESKINKLKNGEIPIFEPGLAEILAKNVENNKISFSCDLKLSLKGSEAVFIAVGTPQGEDGSADLSYVLAVAKSIAELCDDEKTIVTKSTVPVKTAQKIVEIVKKSRPEFNFSVASNPEFLREGSAIFDFMRPDRIVIGCDDKRAEDVLTKIYESFGDEKLVKTDTKTSEMIKYAANAFLATKVSFINEMADLCEKAGANVKDLSKGIGLDSRIGEKFLNPGPGFGGSCFPKDILAILKVAQDYGANLSLISTVIKSNEDRKIAMAQRIIENLGGKNAAKGKKVALLGLAFKANTDDVRYSPAIAIAKELLKNGVKVSATDVEGVENAKPEFKGFEDIDFFNSAIEIFDGADLIVVATEWEEYKKLDFNTIKKMVKTPKIVDLRNLLGAVDGFEIDFIGKKHD
jgi:UDPglucose 6-dehydrogenase